jgi:hypothetical protein
MNRTGLILSLALLLASAAAPAAELVFDPQVVIDDSDVGYALDAGDADGDGDVDLVATRGSNTDSILVYYENAGAGGSWESEIVAAFSPVYQNAYFVRFADLDGDGDLDIVTLGSAAVGWLENTDGAGTFGSLQGLFTGGAGGLYDGDVADLDGDSDLDVVMVDFLNGTVAWIENLGGANFGVSPGNLQTINQTGDDTRSVACGDLDGDGDLDVVAGEYTGGSLNWFENLGGGNFGDPSDNEQTVASGIDAFFTGTGDVDGDGDVDVLSAPLGPDLAWHENVAGDGTTWTARGIASPGGGARRFVPVDFDRDGDLDVLGTFDVLDKVMWFENWQGDGAFWIDYDITGDVDLPMEAVPADLDGDGDLDVASTDYTSQELAWYENRIRLHGDRSGRPER